jgi:hypothetical protein
MEVKTYKNLSILLATYGNLMYNQAISEKRKINWQFGDYKPWKKLSFSISWKNMWERSKKIIPPKKNTEFHTIWNNVHIVCMDHFLPPTEVKMVQAMFTHFVCIMWKETMCGSVEKVKRFFLVLLVKPRPPAKSPLARARASAQYPHPTGAQPERQRQSLRRESRGGQKFQPKTDRKYYCTVLSISFTLHSTVLDHQGSNLLSYSLSSPTQTHTHSLSLFLCVCPPCFL